MTDSKQTTPPPSSSSSSSSSFVISQTTSDDQFKNRTTDIFGCLDSLEQKHNETSSQYETKDEDHDDKKFKRPDQQLWGMRGRGGGGRGEHHRGSSTRGNSNKRRMPRKVADHVMNPKKWTKYSLKEDGTKAIAKGRSAEQVNQKIALDFIEDLKQRSETDNKQDIEMKDNEEETLTFKKPHKLQENENDEKSSSLFGSSHGGKTRVMNTFHFGSTTKKHNKVESIKTKENNSEISLGFQQQDDDDNDDDAEKSIQASTSDILKDNVVDVIDEVSDNSTIDNTTNKEIVTIKKRKNTNRKTLRKRHQDDEEGEEGE